MNSVFAKFLKRSLVTFTLSFFALLGASHAQMVSQPTTTTIAGVTTWPLVLTYNYEGGVVERPFIANGTYPEPPAGLGRLLSVSLYGTTVPADGQTVQVSISPGEPACSLTITIKDKKGYTVTISM